MIVNIIAGAIIVAVMAAAIAHIVKAKKRGVKCIGCPESGCCAAKGAQEALRAHRKAEDACGCGMHDGK